MAGYRMETSEDGTEWHVVDHAVNVPAAEVTARILQDLGDFVRIVHGEQELKRYVPIQSRNKSRRGLCEIDGCDNLHVPSGGMCKVHWEEKNKRLTEAYDNERNEHREMIIKLLRNHFFGQYADGTEMDADDVYVDFESLADELLDAVEDLVDEY